MPRGYPALTADQKDTIIKRVKENGEKVIDLSKEYRVATKTIYKFLGRQTTAPNAILEISRLKRENEALLKIIGQFTYERSIKKN
jgi:N-acetyl-gamma-glutamylphosphate reductase